VESPNHPSEANPSSSRATVSPLASGRTMVWERNTPLIENREAPLHFKIVDATGQPVFLQPYMGMLGTAAIRREDGTVFAHLHPVGTISMASQEFFTDDASPGRQGRDSRTLPKQTEPLTMPAAEDHSKHLAAPVSVNRVSFPYEFPKAGRYRIWVQVKAGNDVMTGIFDADVLAAGG